jgi:hypothetical protein
MPSSSRRAGSASRIICICCGLVALLDGTLPALAQEPSETPPLITDLRVEQEGRIARQKKLLT